MGISAEQKNYLDNLSYKIQKRQLENALQNTYDSSAALGDGRGSRNFAVNQANASDYYNQFYNPDLNDIDIEYDERGFPIKISQKKVRSASQNQDDISQLGKARTFTMPNLNFNKTIRDKYFLKNLNY